MEPFIWHDLSLLQHSILGQRSASDQRCFAGWFCAVGIWRLIPDEGIKHVPPFFISMYATAFAVFCGVLWEFYEFTCDSFGMNLQRYMKNGHLLLGRAALMDTMGDLFADFFGALIFAVIAYFKLRKDSRWIEKFFFHRNL